VSVAAQMALATVGTDTGGSIRIPAAACGTVGLKPSWGEVSTDGVVPLSPALDHVGPLTSTVADAAIVYRALLGAPMARAVAPCPASSLRIGVLRRYFCDVLDDEVRGRFEEAADRLRSAGAQLEDVEVRHANDIAPIYLHIGLADAAAYHATSLERLPDRYMPPVRLRLEMGRYILAEDYSRAMAGRHVLRREVDAILASRDALMLPTLPIPAPTLGASTVEIGTRHESLRSVMLRLTQLFNLTGHPAIAIPSGWTRAGLPCSVQLVGARQRTDELLRVSVSCEPYITGTPSPRSGRPGG
jgi:aspartyl-tRNA(Asn)/glutamyl-tRNA(Gln) amidotransferase subunit A